MTLIAIISNAKKMAMIIQKNINLFYVLFIPFKGATKFSLLLDLPCTELVM